MESEDASRVAAKRHELDELERTGLLTSPMMRRIRELMVPPEQLARWLDLGLLFLGVGLALAGVVFFFAYNWEGLHRFAKLGMIEGVLFVALLVGVRDRDQVRGHLGVLVATVLVGVFWAVYGQIYQTGADAWQLFAAWAGLTALWTLPSRMQAQWGLWVLVMHVLLGTFFVQYLEPRYDLSPHLMALGVALADSALLWARERALGRGATWLRARWGRLGLASVAVVLATAPAFGYLITGELFSDPGAVSVLGWAVVVGALGVTLWHRSRDVAAMALPGLSVISIGFAGLAHLSFEIVDLWALFILGGYTIVSVGALVVSLRWLADLEDQEARDES